MRERPPSLLAEPGRQRSRLALAARDPGNYGGTRLVHPRFFADLNNDGKLEVVAANKGSNRGKEAAGAKPLTEISWLEVPDDPLDGGGWQEHVLSEVDTPINAQPVDLDGDGDTDILGGGGPEASSASFGSKTLAGRRSLSSSTRSPSKGRTPVPGGRYAHQDSTSISSISMPTAVWMSSPSRWNRRARYFGSHNRAIPLSPGLSTM